MTILLVVGTIAGEGPDLDLVFMFFSRQSAKEKKPDDHRLYITHAPIVWLLFSFVITGGGYLFGSAFVETLGLVIFAGSWSHFILDSIEYGIRWLWPFSNKRIYMKKEPETAPIAGHEGFISYNFNFLAKSYYRWLSFYVEISLTALALWIVFNR